MTYRPLFMSIGERSVLYVYTYPCICTYPRFHHISHRLFMFEFTGRIIVRGSELGLE